MVQREGSVGVGATVRAEGVLADEAEVAFVFVPFFLEYLVLDSGLLLVESFEKS